MRTLIVAKLPAYSCKEEQSGPLLNMEHSEEMLGGLESDSDFPELQEPFSRNMDSIMSEDWRYLISNQCNQFII
jgi:hypothetical protein